MPKSDRSAASHPTAGPFDARLSGLTPRQSQRVRELAHLALAGRGLETTMHDHHLETLDGRTFGPGDRPPALSAEEIRAHVHVRLVPLGEVVSDDDNPYTYAPRLGAGFAELLVHKDGAMVRWLTDEDVAKVGADELYALGRKRLRLICPDVVEILRRDGGEIHVLRGESGFVASKLLMLPEVLRHVIGGKVRYPDGVLVAVPCRHELVFAPVGVNVIAELLGIVDYAGMTFNHGLRPLSPHVYWWRHGSLTPLTTIDRTGFVAFRIPEELADVVARLNQDLAG